MQPATDKHFRLLLPDAGQDIYSPRRSQTWGYRYGPTIMVHNGICEAWFASPGDGYEADWFTYRRSEDGGKTWTHERVVMAPVPNSMDWFSVCDPAVIKYGEYYYIGYTSTVFANGGGVCNNGFIARSKSPTGPFERWCGNGWGEQRSVGDVTCRWMGKPAPVIYFDEDWHNWGAGEFSFVIKDETIYVYYTWTSSDRDGKPIHQTRVATADITDENWPATIVQRGVAVNRPGGGNDSYDVVYCEDLDKFVALSTDYRFSENSLLAVYESDDGLRFTRVNEIKVNTGWMCHNCGISGDEHHHIRKGDTLLLAYAYGNQWGCWGTRLHAYDFTVMDEPFYSEAQFDNLHREVKKFDDPDAYVPTVLYLRKPHDLRIRVGDEVELPLITGDVTYAMRPAEGNIAYSNYDPTLISVDGRRITALASGETYVTATLGDLSCEFRVLVTAEAPNEWCPWQPYPEKAVISFTPLITHYNASLAAREIKQLRGIAVYEDDSWFEVAGNCDGVFYENHAPELFAVDENGHILPTGETGTGRVTLRCGAYAFDVWVTILS